MEPFESSRPRLVGGRIATETDPTANSTEEQGLAPANPSCDQLVFLNPDEVRTGTFAISGWTRDRPISKGLILAQNERWRRGLGMQVVRARKGQWRKGE